MFKRFDVTIVSNPVCSEPIYDVNAEDFKYFDKDGFELNQAEQKYYRMMKLPIHHPILNHICWQEHWFELENKNLNLILDHSMILHRCNYGGAAEHQLKKIKKDIPEAALLLDTTQKWGFDFALDAINSNGQIYEVLHVEYDHYDYDEFTKRMIYFDYQVRHIDWVDASKKILAHYDEWKYLKSFAQNDWKANFLVGWKRAEYTEKSLTL
jgi:hypothetical protein